MLSYFVVPLQYLHCTQMHFYLILEKKLLKIVGKWSQKSEEGEISNSHGFTSFNVKIHALSRKDLLAELGGAGAGGGIRRNCTGLLQSSSATLWLSIILQNASNMKLHIHQAWAANYPCAVHTTSWEQEERFSSYVLNNLLSLPQQIASFCWYRVAPITSSASIWVLLRGCAPKPTAERLTGELCNKPCQKYFTISPCLHRVI